MSGRRETLSREVVRAHAEWLGRGRSGDGRLDVTGADASGVPLQAERLAAARFDRVTFRQAILDYADLSETDLFRCDLESARMGSAQFSSARIMNCNFARAAAELAVFAYATIYGTQFDRASLRTSLWVDARIGATSFAMAQLGNAVFDRANIVDCDFRGARIGPLEENPPPSMRGAVFDNCDFRDADFTRANLAGATFTACKFAGARGEPRAVADVTITDADLGDQARVLDALAQSSSVDAVLLHPGPLIAAIDPVDPEHVVVFVVGKRAVPLTRLEPSAALQQLSKGTTYGRSGFVWAAAEQSFTIWSFQSTPVQARERVIAWPGGEIDRGAVTRVGSFVNPDSLGNRGVKLVMPSLSYGRIVIVQENDFAAEDQPGYTRDDARRDGMWALHLGRELAAWLGVPHDDELT